MPVEPAARKGAESSPGSGAGAGPARAVSIFDVAKAAGVSHQTVSRVINGRPRVKEVTRERVREVIDALGYGPNRLARALRGIEEAARGADFMVSISVLDDHAPLTSEDITGRLARPGEPVLVIAFNGPGRPAWRALPVGYPAAAVVEMPPGGRDTGWPVVWLDDRTAAAQATRYPLGLGHGTVRYLAIPSSTTKVGRRTEAWRDALAGAGRPAPEPLEGGWSPRSAYLAARALVADPQVTAVLCGNDELALGVLRAAREAGRDVPGDLSVVGFDDTPYAGFILLALTTVRLDRTSRTAAAPSTATSWSSTSPALRWRTGCTAHCTTCCRRTRSTSSSGT
ncbi:LacI family DNA-binding transcriptional regulator [Streptomyces sp. NPDC058457]|uniref:LacI family DNA-binding transcriptional regulator n=1 Tax=Streptomyces sp. NPDC058457 TaxID=3346507 RepID=UPI00364B5052